MRLTLKITWVLVGSVGSLLSFQAARHLSSLSKMYEEVAARDVCEIAERQKSSVALIWQRDGPDAVRLFLQKQVGIDAEILPAGVAQPGEVIVSLGGDKADPAQLPCRVQSIRVDSAPLLVATIPLLDPEGQAQELVVKKSIFRQGDWVKEVIRTQLGWSLMSFFLCLLIVWWVVCLLVTRPLRELSQVLQKVSTGDFSVRTRIDRSDSLGRFAAELNTMIVYLDHTRTLIQKERQASARAMEQLRHSDRLATLGKLVSGIAHELGTPLNVIHGRASLILEEPNLPEAARPHVQIITNQVMHMTSLLQERLDYATRTQQKKDWVRVDQLVDSALALLAPLSREQQIQMLRTGESELSWCCHETSILQVLVNLMNNAIGAMPEGGKLIVHLEVEQVLRPPELHWKPGQYLKIQVKDEGIGISEELQAQIFKEFFTTKEKGEGTGLGLSICQTIVREHDGWISVQSRLQEGTCFSVYLPERSPGDESASAHC